MCACGEVNWLNKSVLRLLIGELDHNCMIRYETLQHISLWGHAGFGLSSAYSICSVFPSKNYPDEKRVGRLSVVIT